MGWGRRETGEGERRERAERKQEGRRWVAVWRREEEPAADAAA